MYVVVHASCTAQSVPPPYGKKKAIFGAVAMWPETVDPSLEVAKPAAKTNDSYRFVAGSQAGVIYYGTYTQGQTPPIKWVKTKHLSEMGDEAALLCSTSTPKIAIMKVDGDYCIIGTSNHDLLILDLAQEKVLHVLQVSHDSEAWGLAMHPKLELAATCGVERDIRFWDLKNKTPCVGRVIRSEYPAYCVDFSVDGNFILKINQ